VVRFLERQAAATKVPEAKKALADAARKLATFDQQGTIGTHAELNR
jgi:hypothetical protein